MADRDGWIKTSERPGIPGKNCWVFNGSSVFIAQLAYVSSKGWVIPGPEFRAAGNVTHWQPLVYPAPPSEDPADAR